MDFFHGTWDNNKERILEEGYITNFNESLACNDTSLIDNVFNDVLGYNPRENCIYLSNDEKSLEVYDYGFKFSQDELRINMLYVASSSIANDIFTQVVYKEANDEELERLIILYEASMVSLQDFQGIIGNEHELLYFDNIPVSIKNLVYKHDSF